MTSSITRKFDPTKPVQTQDGRKARIICTDRTTPSTFPVIALVTEDNGIESIEAYQLNGRWVTLNPNNRDLVNVPEVTRILVFTSPNTPYLCSQVLNEGVGKEPGDQLIARKKAEGTFAKLIEFEVDK